VPDHPIKPLIAEELATATGFVAVHAKNSGMFVHPNDRAEIHACIGLGQNPTEAMLDLAERIILAIRDDLGLYAVISNIQPAYIQKPKSTQLKRVEDGSPKLSQLDAASKPTISTNFSRQTLGALGRNVSSMQVELTNLLRVTPLDGSKKDKTSRIIGVALGYRLIEKIVKITAAEQDSGMLV
jgi:hypothetical protein